LKLLRGKRTRRDVFKNVCLQRYSCSLSVFSPQKKKKLFLGRAVEAGITYRWFQTRQHQSCPLWEKAEKEATLYSGGDFPSLSRALLTFRALIPQPRLRQCVSQSYANTGIKSVLEREKPLSPKTQLFLSVGCVTLEMPDKPQ